jgi:anti-anti-sigma factor
MKEESLSTASTASPLADVKQLGNVTVVTFLGQRSLQGDVIRFAGEQFDLQTCTEGKRDLLLNLALVESLGSDALSALIGLHRSFETTGARLLLCNLEPSVEEVLQVTGLADLFNIQPSAAADSAEASSSTWGRAPNYQANLLTDQELSVIIVDSQSARAQKVAKAVPQTMVAHQCASLEELAEHANNRLAVAVLLPMDSAAQPVENDSDDSPVLRFVREHSRKTTIFVYGPARQLTIESYCGALAAGAKRIFYEDAAKFTSELNQALMRLANSHLSVEKERNDLISLFASHGIIGDSRAMLDVFRRALKAARFDDLPVLILGETGTGKQRLAEAIHKLDSKRRDKPFLTLNCSAISKTLAESELFGHAKGAFSGAQTERAGLFRMADGGTLLLDEVGELDRDLQPKLLRVLQEHRLLPVGADYEHTVNVRVIAATNRPLPEMIKEGQFREDLYQRLNVFQIKIPSLRERPEDIEVQARHFLKIYQVGRERRATDFGLRVLEALRLLPWEGNTRQLENFIREILAHMDDGTLIQLEDLPHWVLETVARLRPRAPEVDSREVLVQKVYERKMTLNQAMDEFERRLLQVVLERNKGNRTLTAAEFNLTPRSILNKIKKYGLE